MAGRYWLPVPAEEHVLDYGVLVDGVVQCLPDFDIAQVLFGDIEAPVVESGDSFLMEGDIRICLERFNLAVWNRGDDIEITALELQHAGVGVGEHLESEFVEVWLAGVPEVGIFLENDLGLLVPGIKHEWTGAN